MQLRIATYNVNSVRIRLNELKRLVDEANPDIICLQETKVEDTLFPADTVKKLGFAHVHYSGQKSYNGVAILSRMPLSDVTTFDFVDPTHKRHVSARLKDGTEIHNFYVPAGGDVPDIKLNDKFDFKLKFLNKMTEWSASKKGKKPRMVMLGDMNIAPLPHDVWSHKQLLKVVSHTPVETDSMEKLKSSLNWVDTSRHFVPDTEKLYSWWSYRNHDWAASDRGRRLDHIWVTPELKAGLQSSRILRDARGWANPSDHVPVIAEIET
jgi:exodeoxyribonuclease-3